MKAPQKIDTSNVQTIDSAAIALAKQDSSNEGTLTMREASLRLGLKPHEFCAKVQSGALKAFKAGNEWRVYVASCTPN